MLKKKICAFLLMVGIILSLSSLVLSAALDCEFYSGSAGWYIVETRSAQKMGVEIWRFTYDTRKTGTLPSVLDDAGGYMNFAAISEQLTAEESDWWDCLDWVEVVGSRSKTNPSAAVATSTKCYNDNYRTDYGIAY